MSESELRQWTTLANHDAETARLLYKDNGYPEIIIYHMHQAVEKYLKALVLKTGCTIRRTHHIDALLSELITVYPELKEIEEPVLFMHTFSPRLRYPTGDILTHSDVQAASPKFEEVVAAVVALL